MIVQAEYIPPPLICFTCRARRPVKHFQIGDQLAHTCKKCRKAFLDLCLQGDP